MQTAGSTEAGAWPAAGADGRFRQACGEIVAGLEPERLTERLAELIDNVGAFVPELESHSEREEGDLFPLMSRYIGRETGPIAVMEYEHDQAKIRLQMFQDLARQAEDNAAEDRAKELAAYALQAHAILTEHFMKEENVLFPMAERILTPADKEQLARAFRL
ncbi:hemerythrin domain-containing protein [Paenibacillus sp. P26]|nr:hemerythrin domain-containing protein [Paenibacillus sp. P26]UUZ96612.1 hemerythrin domain-containing protein [Paenibacillus sp. P25]